MGGLGDYRIANFYVDKYSGGTVGESGGGGGIVCCLMLPNKWYPGLKAEVRWEVRQIIRSSNPAVPETEETAGFYRAQVPIEEYVKPGDFYVHFFPGGRVRIVVSEFTTTGKLHPIQWDDSSASRAATTGVPVKTLFTAAELAGLEREDIHKKIWRLAVNTRINVANRVGN